MTEQARIDLYAGFDDFCRKQTLRVIRNLNLARHTHHKPLTPENLRREGVIGHKPGTVNHYQGEKRHGAS